MSIALDVDKSTKARADGNTSFKKGRWTEAIGHYTTAIVFNPEDPLGYTNRAAAYLKIDKWKDAERDCSTALSLAKGQPSVKALYRRSLARKALDDIDGALEDIDTVLEAEPTNETALEEKVELEDLRRKASSTKEAKSQKTKTLPPSPPRHPTALPTATITEISTGDDTPKETITSQTSSTPVDPASASKSSFADLKKGRQTGRKAFVAPSTQPPGLQTSDLKRTDSPSSLPLGDIALSPVNPTTTSQSAPRPQPKDARDEPAQPIPILDPLAPGSALSLITSIRRYSPRATYPLIAHLSSKPSAVGKMLDNFIEPDQIVLILKRLNETLDLGTEVLQVETTVRGFMVGMTQTKRWGMTAIMLSKMERELGQEVWGRAGGEGDFTRRQEI